MVYVRLNLNQYIGIGKKEIQNTIVRTVTTSLLGNLKANRIIGLYCSSLILFVNFVFKGAKNFAHKSLADLYIALTRAMASVVIVYDYGDSFKSDTFIPYQLVDIP